MRHLLIGVLFLSLLVLTPVVLLRTFNSFIFTGFFFGISALGFVITHFVVIPKLIPINIKAGLFGLDVYKKDLPDYETKIPECLGIGVFVVYAGVLISIYVYLKLVGSKPYCDIINHCTAYITIGTFLGFVDDVLELRWRHKLIYPFFFSMLLILEYQGDSALHFPLFIQDQVESLLGIKYLNLGKLFFVYLVLLCIFCINSINIYAGISGIESGQSLMIGLFLVLENFFCILDLDDSPQNMTSLLILVPFCATTLSLFLFNKTSAKTFVGDTFCYFAGCVLCAASLVGKYPIKLLFYFIPQLLNFVLSIPQITGWMFCPRHRLPVFNRSTGKLETTCP